MAAPLTKDRVVKWLPHGQKKGLPDGPGWGMMGERSEDMAMEVKPRLPAAPDVAADLALGPDLEEIAQQAADDQQDVVGQRFVDMTLGSVDGTCLEFSGCVFERCIFSQNDVKRQSFVDCIFDHCDLSNMRFERAAFQRVRFQNCRMTGISFGDVVWMNVETKDCHMDYASFSDTKLDRVRLAGCRLRECQFNKVTLSHVTFERLDLTRAQWSFSKLNGMDMRSCEIDGWQVDVGDLRGMRVTAVQAMELSRLLGIVIEDGS